MRRFALAAAAVAVTFGTPAIAEAPGIDPTRLGETIRAAAAKHFGLWDAMRRASFAAAWSRYRATAPRLSDREAVDLEAMRLVASLRNAHSWLEDTTFGATRRWRLPFVLRYVDGAWVVTESRSTDIPDGVVLRTIDGIPAERFFDAHRDLLFASSDSEARALLEQEIRLIDTDAHPPRLTFDDGREFTPSAPRSDPAPGRVVSRWLVEDRIGYIAIPSFDEGTYERDALNALKRFIAADAVIVDVRGNAGGRTPIDFLELLTDRALPWWKESTTAPIPARKPASDGQHIPPADGHYRGRVILLADERCASACEDFVMPLVAAGRARFVGSATYGSTGEPFVARLDGGITIAVGSIHAALPDGKPFEGIGITPTDPVPLRMADIRDHVDAQLDRALAIAEAVR